MNITTDADLTQSPFFTADSHAFNLGVAMATKSLEAAIIFNHIFFWLRQNKSRNINQHDGHTWMYQSMPEIAQQFPYLSEKQVRTALDILIEKGYILKGRYSTNKFDRTNWYSVTNEEWIDGNKKMFAKCPSGPKHLAQEPDQCFPRRQTSHITTDNNTNNKEREGRPAPLRAPSSSSFSKRKGEQVPAIDYGEYVKLKEGEYEKLCAKIGQDLVDYYIEALNNYVPNASPYKDYAAAIRRWYTSDLTNGKIPNLRALKKESDSAQKQSQTNQNLCELAEKLIRHLFSQYVFFQAGPNKAILQNLSKAFKKEYVYDQYELNDLKKVLFEDLSNNFRGAKEILGL